MPPTMADPAVTQTIVAPMMSGNHAANDEPDAMRIWFRFLRLHQRLSASMASRLRAIGLSVPQFDLMSTLSEREGITQSALAERLYVTKGNVSGLVDRLAQAGLIERRAIDGDKRSHALHLTRKGRSLVELGLATQRQYVTSTLGHLPPADLIEFERLVLVWRNRERDLRDAG